MAGIRRLDQVKATLDYAGPHDRCHAARGRPVGGGPKCRAADGGAEALDGDCILAAQTLSAAGPNDTVTAATDNVAHLSRFVDARLWKTITA